MYISDKCIIYTCTENEANAKYKRKILTNKRSKRCKGVENASSKMF